MSCALPRKGKLSADEFDLRDPDIVARRFKQYAHLIADRDVFGRCAHDLRGNPYACLAVEIDDRNSVGDFHFGKPFLVVHGYTVDRAGAPGRSRRYFAAEAPGTDE